MVTFLNQLLKYYLLQKNHLQDQNLFQLNLNFLSDLFLYLVYLHPCVIFPKNKNI